MDPFAVQIPEDARPVHARSGTFSFINRRGYTIEDYTTSHTGGAYLGVSASRGLLRFFSFLLVAILGLFAARAAYLQIVRGDYYRGIAEGNRLRLEELPAARGLIFDMNGAVLADNIPDLALAVRPIDFPKDEEDQKVIFEILEPYGISNQEIVKVVRSRPREMQWLPLTQPLEHRVAVELSASLHRYPGISVRANLLRTYYLEDAGSLSHLLGYVGRPSVEQLSWRNDVGPADILGRTGLEAFYDAELHGQDGRRRIEVDALGNEKEVLASEDPVAGTNLMLNLNLELQKQAEEILQKYLKASRTTSGVVVLLDPRDGAVRALVSWPTFDANGFVSGLAQNEYAALLADPHNPLFPRAIAGTYPSGSTIKPIFGAGALAEGVITPRTTVNSTGGIGVSRWFFPDWRSGGHGPTNIYHAIADSVNTFFYYVGGGYGDFEGLGPHRLATWAKRFGLGLPTGIDLPGEAAGFVPTVDWKNREREEPWYIGDTYHLSIGQGDILVTPLQMAAAYAAIANGGVRFEPRLVRAFANPDGTEQILPPVRRDADFISPEHLRVIREAMRRTVTAGSAASLQAVPAAVAGKTGTAQWSGEFPPHSWFVGFAPYLDPEIVISVLVEEGGGEGSVAVPVAREILAWYFINRAN